jgi:monoamine oxidase
LSARPVYSEPVQLAEVLGSGLWQGMLLAENYDMQTTMFQPVGGMGMVGQAFARELGPLIRYNAKVIDIAQDERGVSVTFEDTSQSMSRQTAHADWCVCTIPLSILGQIPMQVGAPLAEAIAAVPYAASVKVGLQFKRRFWEEDEQIYGGITYTNLPISNISYPNYGFFSSGKGVLLGGYLFGLDAAEFTAMSPPERVAKAVEYGSRIHPQYTAEFENGISVAWHRSPFTLGCFGMWTEAARAKHYDNLCAIDGRIVLAGEHASYMPAWQEGALTSAVDAIGRLHRRALAQGASS